VPSSCGRPKRKRKFWKEMSTDNRLQYCTVYCMDKIDISGKRDYPDETYIDKTCQCPKSVLRIFIFHLQPTFVGDFDRAPSLEVLEISVKTNATNWFEGKLFEKASISEHHNS